VTDTPLAIVSGPPLSEEVGLGELTLSGWFRTVCEQGGDAEALVFYEGGLATGKRISWSYNDLWDRANEVARALIAAGTGKGTRIGILMTNRPEFISATFGAALAGGVATTISTFSTPAELEYLLQISGVSVLLLERQVLKKDFAHIVSEFDPAGIPFLADIVSIGGGAGVVDWDSFLARGKDVSQAQVDARAATNTPADPGALFFSSGSTARPKGILSSHRGVALQLWRWAGWYAAKPGELRMWPANGFSWSGNFGMCLGGAFTMRGSIVLQATFDPEEALTLMEHEKVTFLNAWPHQWGQLIGAKNWATTNLSSLIYMDAKSPIAVHPTINTTWREPYAAYGNTETFTLSSVYPANTPEDVIGGSHGLPCHGNIFKIIDPLTGETLRIGERGEMCVKGPTMMLGYLGIPLDETLDSEGFLRTGDGGWFDDLGRLHWEGRLNDIIKTGGANVSPVEIDTVMKTMPGVKAVQSVGVPHDLLGELVVACIVPHDGAGLTEAGVQGYAKETLASYKVPRRVLFFAEDDLELTGSSKIKTADLRKMATERLADSNDQV
jgi:fatty-acyl-CoA synthase